MKRKRLNKYFRVIVIAALALSILINMNLLFRFSQLQNEMNMVMSHQQNLMNEVSGQTSHFEYLLNEMKQEQSWISEIDMNIISDDKRDGQVEVAFKWQIKELHTNSEVHFHYAYGNREDFITLPVEELQQGLFQVKVPIEIPMEPIWDIGINTPNPRNQQEMSKEEIEAQNGMTQTELQYFVSISYEDMVKSGKIHNEQLDYLGTEYYGHIQTDIHMERDNLFSVILTNHVNDSTNAVEEAYLLMYENDSYIGKEELQIEEQDPMLRFFHLNQVEQYDNMRLVLKVVYTDGATFEKEVFKGIP